jgi:hypothetical protein
MELVWLRIAGFRRFLEAEAHLHGRLIALVGPNEAGKSSVLDALAHLNSGDEVVATDLSHGQTYAPEHVVFRARFWLSDDDRAAIAHLNGGQQARWYIVQKRRDGRLIGSIEPPLSLDLEPRRSAGDLHARVARTKWGRGLSRATEDEPGSRLDRIGDLLQSDDLLSTEERSELTDASSGLQEVPDAPKLLAQLDDRLRTLVQFEPTEQPGRLALRILSGRRPVFLKFSQEHRDLQSIYELNGMDLDNPPAALQNIAELCGLNLRQILTWIQAGDYASPSRPIEEANAALLAFFRESWNQSGVAVRLEHHETRLHVLISSPVGPYTDIREHSDGLRAFVALATFGEVHGSGDEDIVLLIDEAETHLHYNAQADLVRVLDTQDSASGVIYTTHSAGCLPEDLGSTVRVVIRTDDEWSAVQNSFWTMGIGFDPLLLGMGASALVFGAIRRAVVAEGATDLILLPSLIKEATDRRSLGYQIAPGVAEVSGDALNDLELQASRAVYVVDDDEGGRRHAAKLRAAGVEPSAIFVLGDGVASGYAIEDLVKKDVWIQAVNTEMERSGRPDRLAARDVPVKGRSAALVRWCETRSYSEPRKVNLATNIALNARVSAPVLTPLGRQIIKELDSVLRARLGVTITEDLAAAS